MSPEGFLLYSATSLSNPGGNVANAVPDIISTKEGAVFLARLTEIRNAAVMYPTPPNWRGGLAFMSQCTHTHLESDLETIRQDSG
jgi:hypothetical protein